MSWGLRTRLASGAVQIDESTRTLRIVKEFTTSVPGTFSLLGLDPAKLAVMAVPLSSQGRVWTRYVSGQFEFSSASVTSARVTILIYD